MSYQEKRKRIKIWSGQPIYVPESEYFFYYTMNELAMDGIISVADLISAQYQMLKEGYIFIE